jgi:hypothetical protein
MFYENKNPKEYISLIPTSAHSGDGMGNLIALICELCQTLLAKRLAFSEELQATAMEVSILNIKIVIESAFEYNRVTKGIFEPKGKRKLGPSYSNSPNNDTQNKSTTVCY